VKSRPKSGDTLYVGPGIDGVHPCVTKTADNQHVPGRVRALKHGENIIGEALITQPTDEPGIYKVVDTIQGQAAPETPKATNGPAQVATDEYRDGWERIFGAKPAVGVS
jgi:hypothetical protein